MTQGRSPLRPAARTLKGALVRRTARRRGTVRQGQRKMIVRA